MVGTSKILTVSYGTFSCTLEGFDDSFNTMKAIAEYFRGLAADDRYFGAEPPTPDAEMLAKIAEREISRRVDARVDDGGVVLRPAALAAPVANDEPEHDAESRAEVDAARKAAKAARKAEKAEARAKAKAEKQAAKRAAKAEERAKAKAEAEAEAEAAQAAEVAEAETETDADRDQQDQTQVDEPDASTEAEAEAEAEAETADAADQDTAPEQEPAAPLNTAPAHPDANSVAAKLQRIRAVVGDGDTPEQTAISDDLTEQFLPQSETPDVADLEAETLSSEDDAPAIDVSVEAEAEAEEDAVQEAPQEASDNVDMISRVMARQTDDETPDSDTQTEEASDEAGDTVDTDDAEPQQPRARVVRVKRADFEKAMAANVDVADVVQEASTLPDLGLLDGADDLDDYLEDSDFTETDTPADTAEEIDYDLAESLKAISEVTNVSDEPQAAPSGDLSGETDTDDQDTSDAEVEVREDDHTDDTEVRKSADFMSEDPQVDDASLDRLMNETDAQMKEPEGSRRRDAIAQLKAAVAAKEAARQVGEPDDDGQDVENAFRNDLSEAVGPEGGTTPRPRPVARSETRTERPRPAPLKLVAAQRVDVEDAAPSRDGPVMPRRVAAQPRDTNRGAGSFAEFADNMGATELPDLLEAAAAYTAFVEGADEFSRPQILRRVRSVAADDFKREDELRSFAELINTGRFTKVRNGRFQVADDSRFNPERRAS